MGKKPQYQYTFIFPVFLEYSFRAYFQIMLSICEEQFEVALPSIAKDHKDQNKL